MKRSKVKRLLIGIAVCTLILSILFHALAPKIEASTNSKEVVNIAFVNGLGQTIKNSTPPQNVQLYFPEKGRYYICFKLQNKQKFYVHYFHCDIRVRSFAAISLDLKNSNTAIVQLKYNDYIQTETYDLTKHQSLNTCADLMRKGKIN